MPFATANRQATAAPAQRLTTRPGTGQTKLVKHGGCLNLAKQPDRPGGPRQDGPARRCRRKYDDLYTVIS